MLHLKSWPQHAGDPTQSRSYLPSHCMATPADAPVHDSARSELGKLWGVVLPYIQTMLSACESLLYHLAPKIKAKEI